jgi:hypothetical protein
MKFLVGLCGVAFVFALAPVVIASGPSRDATPSASAVTQIPAELLPRYIDAAATCPGLPWTVLAAIGFVESRHAQGRADPTTGDVTPPIVGPALDGRMGSARIADPSSRDGWMHAQGPMQFLPTTWQRWARIAPGRPPGASPSPNNAWDAIYSAAAYLCNGRSQLNDVQQAILSYNPSATYLQAVVAKAVEYGFVNG